MLLFALEATLVLAGFALLAASAKAAGWSAAADLGRGFEAEATFPRAAIAADGTAVVTWWQSVGGSRTPDRLMLATGDRRGRFGTPRTLSARFTGGVELYPFAQRGGRYTIVWSDGRGLHVKRRGAAGRLVLRGKVRAADVVRDGAGWLVLYAGATAGTLGRQTVNVVRLDARGRVNGSPQQLGTGYLFPLWDRGKLLAVDDDGRAYAVWTAPRSTPYASQNTVELLSTRPGSVDFTAPAVLDPIGFTASVVHRPGVGTIVGWTHFAREKEWAVYGTPQARLAGRTLSVPLLPGEPARGTFHPQFMPLTGGRALVVYQYHDPARFYLTGPLRAVVVNADGTAAATRRLSDGKAKEPQLQPLSGNRTLAVWSQEGTWHAALADAGGDLRSTSAPAGVAARGGHSAQTNRDLRTGGRYAILTWDRGGRVRASVRGF